MCKDEEGSEFGSGIVVCLAKFSQHLDVHSSMHPKNQAAIRDSPVFGSDAEKLSDSITLWMNGASDHFYDLDKEKAGPKLKELAELCLVIGHGFRNEIYTKETVDRIYKLWREACIEVDMMLGIDADWGRW